MLEWQEIPENQRKTLLLLEQHGRPPDIITRRIELPHALSEFFEIYFEIDRDETGRPKFSAMREALDELEISDRGERRRLRAYWWAMSSIEARNRKARLEKAPKPGTGKPTSEEGSEQAGKRPRKPLGRRSP